MLFLFLRKSNSVNVHKLRNILYVCFLAVLTLASAPPVSAHPFPEKEKKHKTTSHKKKYPPRDPKKATLMAMLPGLGQIYNHKYWKVPIVYAGFVVIGYFAVTNRRYYETFRKAYNCKVINPKCKNPPVAQKYTVQTLRIIRDYYRRNMQLSYIIGGGWYLLQMIDANVDAHLSHWNVSSNLSLDIAPSVQPANIPNSPIYKGISLRFRF